MESILIKVFLFITNAIIIPIFIPLLNWLLRKDDYTADIKLVKNSDDKSIRMSKSDNITPFIEELPTAYFANLVSIVVYMYSEHFRIPFLIIYYILTVYCILLIIFSKKDFPKKCKEKIVKWIGIILLLFTFIIAIGPYIKVKANSNSTQTVQTDLVVKERNTFFIAKENQ